ncbi:outer membrane beta-barrel protein [Flammeovirga aprica]|uniref:Porin family protein n=1 Tax=Flammeovirga aprica JL-4 TaxID=694437 RepID=A0A7X9XAB0_9BACT|nr:outer membrane beta-barrel protein [Flammeovirga aprica]NME69418.1 porin family protein [Flammeovirga aprica JL-4]
MKKLTFILLLSIISLTSFAQDKLISVGFGGGISGMYAKKNQTDYSGVGGNFFLNAYYNITPKLSIGAEYEGTIGVLAPSKIDSKNFEATAMRNISGKVLYHFGESSIRPFVGLGVGKYTIVPGKFNAADPNPEFDVANLPEASSIGFSPEVGVDLGWFQLAALYHIVPNLEFKNTEIGNVSAEYNSLEFRAAINLGFIER